MKRPGAKTYLGIFITGAALAWSSGNSRFITQTPELMRNYLDTKEAAKYLEKERESFNNPTDYSNTVLNDSLSRIYSQEAIKDLQDTYSEEITLLRQKTFHLESKLKTTPEIADFHRESQRNSIAKNTLFFAGMGLTIAGAFGVQAAGNKKPNK